jgi:hypothetical protein
MTAANTSAEIAALVADAPCTDTECVAIGRSRWCRRSRLCSGISDQVDDRLRARRQTGCSPQSIPEAGADGTLRHVFTFEPATAIYRKHVFDEC